MTNSPLLCILGASAAARVRVFDVEGQGGAFGCLGRSRDRRGQSVMEWLLSSPLSCLALAWIAPLHPTLKGTLLAKGEWDILATDPRSRGVKGNRGADERERNYRPKTKSKPVCKQLFWWEAERGSGWKGVYDRDQDIFPRRVMCLLSHPHPGHVRPGCGSHWQSLGYYLMAIGWPRRAQEVTAWFPQSHPCL